MPEFLQAPFADGPEIVPYYVVLRLIAAFALGILIALVHVRVTGSGSIRQSFPSTLVMMCCLIAMVTEVVGDNVARAFSLVGALSIVRFRTVVRDTRDTAFVIFSVVVGMAVGSRNPLVGLIGVGVVGGLVILLSGKLRTSPEGGAIFLLRVRLALGMDHDKILARTLAANMDQYSLMSVSTVKQGTLVEVIYEGQIKADSTPDQLVQQMKALEGVMDVRFERKGFEDV
jgi:hypothetical protein